MAPMMTATELVLSPTEAIRIAQIITTILVPVIFPPLRMRSRISSLEAASSVMENIFFRTADSVSRSRSSSSRCFTRSLLLTAPKKRLTFSVQYGIISLLSSCRRGGIGRRSGLKIRRSLRSYRFKSGRRHQLHREGTNIGLCPLFLRLPQGKGGFL